ncbi:helix-turn-helix domain-containing protein [Streptomyces boluensis]|uniref:Helix-turn-helix domain-containing protein n=1 Tax=Streptomyces boluensis TaxID=1775135 RepID=A0A964XM66_9ACTN|nr:helix-turn-helix transcriptional regulator [Streptomyces boluensis]NBE52851.1 helix-turn-helix domain-containing protein [Streptomyces boluensis]
MTSTYGEWLKAQREARGWTQQQLADEAMMTRTHIAHIEAGRRVPSEEDARRLDRALGTGDVLSSFRPDGHSPHGFRPQDNAVLAAFFEAAHALEQQAVMVREFASTYVPGILQTRGYATAVLDAWPLLRSEEERDRHVVTRLERSDILRNPLTPEVWALLDDAVLRRPVGGGAVMAEQIEHLVGLVEEGRIRVHVMPATMGAYGLLNGMVSLMWFEDQPPAAYSEGASVGKLHDSPDVVQYLQHAYDLALSDALPLKESLDLMRARAKEHRGQGSPSPVPSPGQV